MRVVAGTSVFVVVVVLVGKLVFAVAASAGRLVPAGKLVFALPAAAAFVDRFASTMAAFDGRLALEVAVFVGRLVFAFALFDGGLAFEVAVFVGRLVFAFASFNGGLAFEVAVFVSRLVFAMAVFAGRLALGRTTLPPAAGELTRVCLAAVGSGSFAATRLL